MDQKTQQGKKIQLDATKPTKLSLKELYHWVIWQFPHASNEGSFAAVHPPLDDSGWYPAVIKSKKRQVLIYGHLDLQFGSPEETLTYLSKHHKE